MGLSGIQKSNINQVSRRVSENDGNIATLQTKVSSTCAKVNYWSGGGANGGPAAPLQLK